MFGFEHHRPTTISPEMDKAIKIIAQALTTDKQKKAREYWEAELGMASAYITELQWDVAEAASLIGNYIHCCDWVLNMDYLQTWAKEWHQNLVAHREIQLTSMIEKPAT